MPRRHTDRGDTPEARYAWTVRTVGARGGSPIRTDTRGAVKWWLCNNHNMPRAFVDTLTLADLDRAWNDTTDAHIAALKTCAVAILASERSETRTDTAQLTTTTTTTTTKEPTLPLITADMLPASNDVAAAAAALAAALAAQQPKAAPIDADTVRAIVQDEAGATIAGAVRNTVENVKTLIAEATEEARRAAAITVTVRHEETGEAKDLGMQHERFPLLLRMIQAKRPDGSRLNVWLRGPAGSGKTTAARKAAEALGLPFHFNGAVDTEYKLLGFTDATGKVVRRAFREAWEHGGVYLFDEVDASMPGAVLALNAALANGYCDFPDGCLPKHADCIIIAAANTWGLGANAEYVGRIRQDAAFLDRFVKLDWPYDEKLETALCPNPRWARHVQKTRANVAAKGIKAVISPRATYDGAALLAAGLDWDEVEAATIRGAMSDEQWESVRVFNSQQMAA